MIVYLTIPSSTFQSLVLALEIERFVNQESRQGCLDQFNSLSRITSKRSYVTPGKGEIQNSKD
jgi:hypothetical protein